MRLDYSKISIGTRYGRWVTTGPMFYGEISTTGLRVAWMPCTCDCGTVKSVQAYNLTHGSTQGCKACQIYQSNSGSFTRERVYKGKNGKIYQNRGWLIQEKSQPCVDCNHSFPHYCMQFDHVPGRGEKLFMVNLAAAHSKRTLPELKREREKCDLVCAVCHFHRTWERANNLPHVPLRGEVEE